MKRYFNRLGILVLIIIIFTVGCKKNVDEITTPINNPIDNTGDVADKADPEKVMKEFENQLKSKDLNKVIDYINNNIEKLSTIEGDRMILELEELLEASLERLSSEILNLTEDEYDELMELKGNELFFPKSKVKDISNEKVREKIDNLFNNYYKLINIEGMFEPIIDYEALKKYNNHISDEIKDYIKIKANNSNEPMAIDGALRISYEELGQRILEVEEYIKKYFEGQKYEEVLGLYRTWLGLYLNGLPNTPIEDFENKIIRKEVYDSFKKTAKVKDSATAFVVNKYLEIIDENRGIIDDSVRDQVLSLVNEALYLLEASK